MLFAGKKDYNKKYFKREGHIHKEILGAVLMALLFALLGNPVYAAEASLVFDQEAYFLKKEEDFEIKMTIQAEGQIGAYRIMLRYDASRMEYISGAETEEDGVITLEGTGFDSQVTYVLAFHAAGAGEAGIQVTDAIISSVGEDAGNYTVSALPAAPITIEGNPAEGEAPEGPSFFDRLPEDGQDAESGSVYGISTNIPISGSIADGDGNILYVVDLADYEPDMRLWDYRLVTDAYINQSLTYFTDHQRNVRVVLVMDERENFFLYAFEKTAQRFYAVNEISSGDLTYYIMSLKACQTLPEGLTEEADNGTIFYGISQNGAGGYYRYTVSGVLEEWTPEPGPDEDETGKGYVAVAAVIGFLTILLAIVLLVNLSSQESIRSIIRKRIKGISSYIAEKKQYLFVIQELTSREVKRKYARSHLGIIWSVLNPLLMMIVMSMVFSYMFKRSIDNFPLYYLTGSLFWELFSNGTNQAMSALVDNKSLLLKAKLPRQTFVLSRMYTALVNFGFSIVPYALMLVLFKIKPSWTMLLLPLDVALTFAFAMGVGYLLSILYVFFADIRYLYSVFLRILLYLTAIFYPVSSLPEALQSLIGWNPVYMSIYIARECMVYGRVPYYTAWVKLALAALISCTVGWIVFKKNQNLVMQKI